MKILVISDTHENYPLAMRAIDLASPVDAVIHLGDCSCDADQLKLVLDIPLIRVAGNCDFDSEIPREIVWECEGKRILLLHGDRYGVKSGLARLEKHAADVGVDAVLFGHTHLAAVTSLSGILFVNPGSLTKSCVNKSFAIVEVSPSGITARLQDIPCP
jgi:putative phosphoesterase